MQRSSDTCIRELETLRRVGCAPRSVGSRQLAPGQPRHRRRAARLALTLGALTSIAALACDEEARALPESAQLTAVVTPEGGVLELDDGARLIVPGSSLTAETEITLTRECGGVYKSAAFESCVYGVKASADTLAGGVTLVLPGVANANSRAMVQTDDGFRALAQGSVLQEISSEGSLSISRFGAYARMRSLENVDDARCSGLSFEPCGGDPVGDWELVCSTGTYEQLLGISWSGPDPYATCLPNHVLREHP